MDFKKLNVKRAGLILLVVVLFAVPLNLVLAYNIINWGWSDNIGWVSMEGSDPSYAVSINSSTGELTGYAWTDTVGWIKFNPSGPYPASPDYSAKVDLNTNEASGWARVCTVAEYPETCTGDGHLLAGGWEGWISLRGSYPDNGGEGEYGVVLSGTHLHGWAWSDDFGWISLEELPARKGNIILKMKGHEMGISINHQGLIEVIR